MIMIRRILRGFLVTGLCLVVLLSGLVIALWPPAPLHVPEKGVVLSGVTVVNPGHDRRPYFCFAPRGHGELLPDDVWRTGRL